MFTELHLFLVEWGFDELTPWYESGVAYGWCRVWTWALLVPCWAGSVSPQSQVSADTSASQHHRLRKYFTENNRLLKLFQELIFTEWNMVSWLVTQVITMFSDVINDRDQRTAPPSTAPHQTLTQLCSKCFLSDQWTTRLVRPEYERWGVSGVERWQRHSWPTVSGSKISPV